MGPRTFSRPPRSQLAHSQTHLSLCHLSSPRALSLVLTPVILLGDTEILYLILFFLPRRSNSSHFPAVGETHKHARARTRPPQMLPLQSRGRRRKHKHPRAGLAPARQDGELPRQAGPGLASGRVRRAPGPGVAEETAPPSHLHSARRGPGGGGDGGGEAAGAGAAAAGEAAAAVAAGLRAAKTCRQPAGGRGTGRRGRGAGRPGRAAWRTAEAAARRAAGGDEKETDQETRREIRAAPPGFEDGNPGRAGGALRPPTRRPPPEEAAPHQPPEPLLLLQEPRRAWPWPWPLGAGAAAAAGVVAVPAAAEAEPAVQRRQLSGPSLAPTHVHTPESRGRGVRAISSDKQGWKGWGVKNTHTSGHADETASSCFLEWTR
nr:spidroin-2-like [Dasypus novemcinctus]